MNIHSYVHNIHNDSYNTKGTYWARFAVVKRNSKYAFGWVGLTPFLHHLRNSSFLATSFSNYNHCNSISIRILINNIPQTNSIYFDEITYHLWQDRGHQMLTLWLEGNQGTPLYWCAALPISQAPLLLREDRTTKSPKHHFWIWGGLLRSKIEIK